MLVLSNIHESAWRWLASNCLQLARLYTNQGCVRSIYNIEMLFLISSCLYSLRISHQNLSVV